MVYPWNFDIFVEQLGNSFRDRRSSGPVISVGYSVYVLMLFPTLVMESTVNFTNLLTDLKLSVVLLEISLISLILYIFLHPFIKILIISYDLCSLTSEANMFCLSNIFEISCWRTCHCDILDSMSAVKTNTSTMYHFIPLCNG